jgi:hypothetical protein
MVDLLIKWGARYNTDQAKINAEKIATFVKQCLLTNSMCAVSMSSFDDRASPLKMFQDVTNLHPQLNTATSQNVQQPSLSRPALPSLRRNLRLSALPSSSVQSALQTPAFLVNVSSLPPSHPFAKGSFLLPTAGNNAQSSLQAQKNNSLHQAVTDAKDPAVIEEIAKALKDCIDEKDGSGRTPLAIAVSNGNMSVVEILCRYGANPNATVPSFIGSHIIGRDSLLEIAVKNRNEAMVDLLIKWKARYDTGRARLNAERIAESVKYCLLAKSLCAVAISRFDDRTSPLEMFRYVTNLDPQLIAATSQHVQQPSLSRPILSALQSSSSVQSSLATPASSAMITPVTSSSLSSAATVSNLPPLHPFAKGSSLAPAAGNNAQSSQQAQKNNSMQVDEWCCASFFN